MTLKFWSIEGNTQSLDGGAMFGNAPKAMWSQWMTPDDANRVALSCRCLLVEGIAGGKRVLFETGIGAFFEPRMRERFGVVESGHRLLESLSAIGLSDADIDAVVISHLHFDHAGGLLSAWQPDQPSRLLFPNARYIVGREAFERACNPHPRDRASFIPELQQLLIDSGRLELVDGERTPSLGNDVRFVYSHGHTPGLMLSEIGSDPAVVFCADLIPGSAWVHVPVTMGYDRYPELLVDEKRAFLDDKLARGVRLFFTHDPACALAGLSQDAKGKFLVQDPQPRLEAWAG